MSTTEAPPPPPNVGTPESAEWFRAMLEEVGESQSSMARLMERNGDDRKPATILRNIQRMANGEARVSGEMRVILTMINRAQKNRLKAAGQIGVRAPNPQAVKAVLQWLSALDAEAASEMQHGHAPTPAILADSGEERHKAGQSLGVEVGSSFGASGP